MPKVLIADKMSPAAEQIFKDRGVDVDVITGLDKDALMKIIGDYDGMAVRSSTKATPAILEANASTHDGKWEKSRFMGVELTGKTLGVVGCGNIGSIAATRALGLKMKVVAFDPFLTPERALEIGVGKRPCGGCRARCI